MNEDLARFVDHAREQGMDLATLRQVLGAAGWDDHAVTEAFCAQALDLPVPSPGDAAPAKQPAAPFSFRDTLFHVLSFAALYTWVISLIVLFFNYINLAFPEASDNRYVEEWAHSSIRWALAFLIVSFPLFLGLWRVVLRQVQRFPEKADGVVRKALIYLSLLVAALTLASDVIVLVYYLINGEATTRFILKVFVLFVLTGAVFLYLAYALRPDQGAAAEEEEPATADEVEPAPEAQS